MRYPWQAWADGDWWLLAEGLDYVGTRDAFVATLFGYAARSGLSVTLHRASGCVAARFA